MELVCLTFQGQLSLDNSVRCFLPHISTLHAGWQIPPSWLIHGQVALVTTVRSEVVHHTVRVAD